jgi:hypothetical protein
VTIKQNSISRFVCLPELPEQGCHRIQLGDESGQVNIDLAVGHQNAAKFEHLLNKVIGVSRWQAE